MSYQSRAQLTRKAIFASATEVIDEVGYSNLSLTEVIDRAGVTKGAFYYHFPTKAALASAISADADSVIEDEVRATWDSSSAATGLENLVRAVFVVADRARCDRGVRIGFQLTDAVGNAADRGRCERQRAFLVTSVETAIAQGDIRTEVNAQNLGYALWVSLLGNLLLFEAAGEELIAGVAGVLRVILAGSCSDHSVHFFDCLVERLAAQYARPAHEQLVGSSQAGPGQNPL